MNKYSKLSKQVQARIYCNRFYERCPIEKHHLLYNRGRIRNTNPVKPTDDKKLSEENLDDRTGPTWIEIEDYSNFNFNLIIEK